MHRIPGLQLRIQKDNEMAGKNKRLRQGGSKEVSANASASNNDNHDSEDQLHQSVLGAITRLGETVAKIDKTLERVNERLEKTEAALQEITKKRDHLIAENAKLEKGS